MPMSRRGALRRGLRLGALVAACVVVAPVTAAMLLLPPASPRRVVAGLLEAGEPDVMAFLLAAAGPVASPPSTC